MAQPFRPGQSRSPCQMVCSPSSTRFSRARSGRSPVWIGRWTMTRCSSAMSSTRTRMTPRGRWRWAETSAMDRMSWQRAAMARAPRSASGSAPQWRWCRPAFRSPGRRGWAECARRSWHRGGPVAGRMLAARRGSSWRCLTWQVGQPAGPGSGWLPTGHGQSTTRSLIGLHEDGGYSWREGGLELGPQRGGKDVTGAADQHGHFVGDHAHVAGGASQHR